MGFQLPQGNIRGYGTVHGGRSEGLLLRNDEAQNRLRVLLLRVEGRR